MCVVQGGACGTPPGSRGDRARRRLDLGRASPRSLADGSAHAQGCPLPGARARRLRPRREGSAGAPEDDRGAAGHHGDDPHRRIGPSPVRHDREPLCPGPIRAPGGRGRRRGPHRRGRRGRDGGICRRGLGRAPRPGAAFSPGLGVCRAAASVENRAEPRRRDRCESRRARRRVARLGGRAARGGA